MLNLITNEQTKRSMTMSFCVMFNFFLVTDIFGVVLFRCLLYFVLIYKYLRYKSRSYMITHKIFCLFELFWLDFKANNEWILE